VAYVKPLKTATHTPEKMQSIKHPNAYQQQLPSSARKPTISKVSIHPTHQRCFESLRKSIISDVLLYAMVLSPGRTSLQLFY